MFLYLPGSPLSTALRYEELVTRCWSRAPKARPTIDEVLGSLATILDALPAWEAGRTREKGPTAENNFTQPCDEGVAVGVKSVAQGGVPSATYTLGLSVTPHPGWITGSEDLVDAYCPVITAGAVCATQCNCCDLVGNRLGLYYLTALCGDAGQGQGPLNEGMVV